MTAIQKIPGIVEIFKMKKNLDPSNPSWVDNDAFNEVVVIVGNSTWEVLQAKKALKCEWEMTPEKSEERTFLEEKLQLQLLQVWKILKITISYSPLIKRKLNSLEKMETPIIYLKGLLR